MKIKTPKREIKSFRNKYLALTIISLLFFATSQAQWIKPNNSYGTISNRASIDSVLLFPTGCGTPALNTADSTKNKYAIYGDSCNNKVYFYNPKTKTWGVIGGAASNITGLISAGSNVTITGTGTSEDPYVINSSGSGGTTKHLLQGYGIIIDSSGDNYTIKADTTVLKDSTNLSKYLHYDSTTKTLSVVISNDPGNVFDSNKVTTEYAAKLFAKNYSDSLDALKLNISALDGGTTNQVLKKNSSTNGDWSWQDESGGTTIDTTSLSNRIDAKLNISDTAAMLSPYLRRTNIVAGTNISTTGTGTDADPIVINASGTSAWTQSGSNIYYNTGNVLIGKTADDGHTFQLDGTVSFNLGGDLTGDIFTRNSLGTFIPVHPPTGLTNPVLGFSTIPVWQEGGIGSDSIVSFSKNSTRDSIILLLESGRRFSVKDSIGGGSTVYYDTAVGVSGNVNWTVTMPGITSYYKGLTVYVYFNTASTGINSTLNINSLGAVTLKYNISGTSTNEIANQTLELVYDGTYFQILNYDYHVLPKTNIVNNWTATQSYPGGINSVAKIETFSQNFRGNIWMPGNGTSGAGIGSTTWADYQENGNNLSFRTGFVGSSSVTTIIPTGNDFANVVLGKTPATFGSATTHALASNLEVLTPAFTNSGTVTDAQVVYFGDAPTIGTFNNSINAGTSKFRGPIKTAGYTVATLPTGRTGDVAYVTDASSPSYLAIVTGGGSTVCPVFYNGTNWVCH